MHVGGDRFSVRDVRVLLRYRVVSGLRALDGGEAAAWADMRGWFSVFRSLPCIWTSALIGSSRRLSFCCCASLLLFCGLATYCLEWWAVGCRDSDWSSSCFALRTCEFLIAQANSFRVREFARVGSYYLQADRVSSEHNGTRMLFF